nr:hypothetical protein [Bacteroides faecichinchillae]
MATFKNISGINGISRIFGFNHSDDFVHEGFAELFGRGIVVDRIFILGANFLLEQRKAVFCHRSGSFFEFVGHLHFSGANEETSMRDVHITKHTIFYFYFGDTGRFCYFGIEPGTLIFY